MMVVRGFYGMIDLEAVVAVGGVVELARSQAALLLEGGAAVLQVRMKRAGAAALATVARAVGVLCRERGAWLVVNDRLDVALAVGADAVHLGQEDLPLERARTVAAGRLAIGVSTHSRAQAVAAARAGADYLGFGPVFPTTTKRNPDPVQGLSALAEVVAAVAPLPVVAIGGITPGRAAAVAATGAAAACAVAAVNHAPDVVAAAREIVRAFAVGG